MIYKFKAYGHPNITAKHKTTLEFTKDKELSLRGDCIIGVRADFNLQLIKNFISQLKKNKIKIIIELEKPPLKKTIKKNSLLKNKNNQKIKEEIKAEVNPDFNSDKEMVIRKSDFVDERTFAVRSDKGAFELRREFIEHLKKEDCFVEIVLDD